MADSVLDTYEDWHDFTSWPQVPGAVSYQKLAVRRATRGKPELLVHFAALMIYAQQCKNIYRYI